MYTFKSIRDLCSLIIDYFLPILILSSFLFFPTFLFGQTFTKITSGPIATDRTKSHGTNWIDYDNDGHLDLFIANEGENFLYRNQGNGNFIKITTGQVVTDNKNSISASWGDYDQNGTLDLYTANYFYGSKSALYNNNGNGTFSRVATGVIVNDDGTGHSCSWGDYDNDNDLDLFVATAATDRKNILYMNNGSTFTKVQGAIVTEISYSFGNSWTDYDNDPSEEVLCTLNRIDQINDAEFKCFAYEPKKIY